MQKAMSATEEHIKTILSVIPESPGCYQYFDEKGTIIYVGKAKNLKRRVSSYFNKEHDSNKTRVLVKQIRDIKYFVVDTEEDALLLENNLIKPISSPVQRAIERRQDLSRPSLSRTNISRAYSKPGISYGTVRAITVPTLPSIRQRSCCKC